MYKKIMAKKGFTLTEMMTVAVVLSILVAVVVGNFRSSLERAKFNEGLQAAEAVAASMSNYYYDNPDLDDRMRPTMDELDISLSNAGGCTAPSDYCVGIRNFEVSIPAAGGQVEAVRRRGGNNMYTIRVFAPYMRNGGASREVLAGGSCTPPQNADDTTCRAMGYTTPCEDGKAALCKF